MDTTTARLVVSGGPHDGLVALVTPRCSQICLEDDGGALHFYVRNAHAFHRTTAGRAVVFDYAGMTPVRGGGIAQFVVGPRTGLRTVRPARAARNMDLVS